MSAPLDESDLPYAPDSEEGDETAPGIPVESAAGRMLTVLLSVCHDPEATQLEATLAAAAVETLHHLCLADRATAEHAAGQGLEHLGLGSA